MILKKRCEILVYWWAKPQVHGFTEVVKREYRSDRELFNSINFQDVIRRKFDSRSLGFKGFKTIIIKSAPWDYWFIVMTNPSQANPKP